jgi:hypothetical protein
MNKIFHYALNASEGEIGGAHLMAAYADPSDQGSSYPYFYPLTFLWRTTPVVLIGLVLGIIALFARRAALFSAQTRWTLLAVLGYVAVYGLLMTLGQKKFDRYFLPAYPALELVAAAGWLAAARWLRDAPAGAEWRSHLMRVLSTQLQNDTLPLGSRARIAGAFYLSRDPSTVKLFKQLLVSKSDPIRRVALLAQHFFYLLCDPLRRAAPGAINN